MKKILGIDLGTNSIGWAIVNQEQNEEDNGSIIGLEAAGSRIIPMDAAQLGDFDKGNSVSQTSERTRYRSMRRLYQRRALRRERLLRVLNVMGFLPQHFASATTRHGKFQTETLLAWRKGDDGKMHFLFQDSYEEMLSEFRKAHPQWLENGAKVPYDWTLYYLRKKALTQALTPEELAWVLLQFNQKRGYHLLRGQSDEFEEQDTNKIEELESLKIIRITEEEVDKKDRNKHWYNMELENGLSYRRSFASKPDWEGQVRDFIITTKLDSDGRPKKNKQGEIERSISSPKPDAWGLLKKKTEKSLHNSGMEVGEFIFGTLLKHPEQKIIGQFVRTIDRAFYKQELKKIVDKQSEFLPQLKDRELYAACIGELYPSNDAYRASIANRDFTYLLVDDILFYQRPLRSKKNQIDECNYESHTYVGKDGKEHRAGVKCIAKSHPLFQEFRLWQFISNLRIYELKANVNGRVMLDYDVTDTFLSDEDSRVRIFDILSEEKEVDEKNFFSKCLNIKSGKKEPLKYRWNYVREEKKYPCMETRYALLSALKKANVDAGFLTAEHEEQLWHILYSVDDKDQLRRSLQNYAGRNHLPDAFAEAMSKVPAFEKDYGAYSAKAIKRLLPLMRMGKYWNMEAIDEPTRLRINHFIDGKADETVNEQTRKQLSGLSDISQCHGMPLHLACYLAYGRHSEQGDAQQWNSPDDIDTFLKGFKQHSLRNPVVEQVVTETLRTVRDIWRQTGRIDEIHLEMGRNLKQTAEERKKATDRINSNETRNLRIKALLTEFVNPTYHIEGVIPYSPSQQDLLQIYEENALDQLTTEDEDYDFIREMTKLSAPNSSQIARYKSWLDQKYISPYTGQPIPLARLFTPEYEIEHIIPRSRFFDDSFQNKVICEAAVNKIKDNQTGMEFIRNHGGEIVELGNGKSVTIFREDTYTQHVTKNFAHNNGKMQRLLMDDIPDGFIERQMNDSRYISNYVKALLSHIVRDEADKDNATSRNLITTNGSITDRLKKEWGINDVWNHIILPRFQRLNILPANEGKSFTTINKEGHEIPCMPLDLQKGFNKKRIDHRHHAMDAIVIACTTRSHVQLLNNEAAKSGNETLRQQLSHKLRNYKKIIIKGKERQIPDTFKKPWNTFTQDVESALGNIIVSFKQNLRVINRTKNRFTRYVDGQKCQVPQTKGDQWAIRKPMHKETVFGEVNLQRIKEVRLKEALTCIPQIVNADFRKELATVAQLYHNNVKQITSYFTYHKDEWAEVNLDAIKVMYYTRETNNRYFASRKPLDTTFDKKAIESITDTGIQKILRAWLEQCGNDPKTAFSPEGIEEMNLNIQSLNNGRSHQPIRKVRVFEQANKFAVGQTGNKGKKFVEAAKGTNLFFAIYEQNIENKKTGEIEVKRTYYSVPLNEAIDRQKQGLPPAPDNENGLPPTFVLSPGDLVYLPTTSQIGKQLSTADIEHNRIYKMVSCTGNKCHFLRENIASIILDKKEFEAQNKMERALTGEMIKEKCIPIRVDRLGNIIEINGLQVK